MKAIEICLGQIVDSLEEDKENLSYSHLIKRRNINNYIKLMKFLDLVIDLVDWI